MTAEVPGAYERKLPHLVHNYTFLDGKQGLLSYWAAREFFRSQSLRSDICPQYWKHFEGSEFMRRVTAWCPAALVDQRPWSYLLFAQQV